MKTVWKKWPDEKPAPSSHCVALVRRKETGWIYFAIAYFDKDNWERGVFDDIDRLDILRWFEIPEPPPEEEE